MCLFANPTTGIVIFSRRIAPLSIQNFYNRPFIFASFGLDAKAGPILQNAKTCFVKRQRADDTPVLAQQSADRSQTAHSPLFSSGTPPRRTVSRKTSEYSPAQGATGGQLLQLSATTAAFSLVSALDLSHGARALPSINSEGWKSNRGVASMPRFGCPSKSAFSCRKRQRWVGRWVGLRVCGLEVALRFSVRQAVWSVSNRGL